MTHKTQTLLLNKMQIEQRINRIAFQIYEDCYSEKEIIIAGIKNNGYLLAAKIETALKQICKLKTTLVSIKIDKEKPLQNPIEISMSADEMHHKTVVLVDDVLNSGRTLMYALRKVMNADLKKLRTVLLVDRDHKRYPVNADFVGITLSTTLQQHISCNLKSDNESVYLS
jgi:pyrimidine operon attenuation protein/uracil phosphoribosyltransferase